LIYFYTPATEAGKREEVGKNDFDMEYLIGNISKHK